MPTAVAVPVPAAAPLLKRPTIVGGYLQRKKPKRADGASTPPPTPRDPDDLSGALLAPRKLDLDFDL